MTISVAPRGPVAHVRGAGNAGGRLSMQRVDGVAYFWRGQSFCYGVPADSLALGLLDIDGASVVLPESDGVRSLRIDRHGALVTVWGSDSFVTVPADEFERATRRARLVSAEVASA